MIIAIPTGVKIFSWLINSLSKNIKLTKQYIYILYNKLYNEDITIPVNKNTNLLLPYLNNKNLLQVFRRTNRNYIESNNICKELVKYGTSMENILNFPKMTPIIRNMYNIPNDKLYIIIGIILSDGWLEHTNKNNLQNSIFNNNNNILNYTEEGIITKHNCRLKIKQSLIHISYLLHIYSILLPYCIRMPYLVKTTLKGKIHYGLEISTISLPIFSLLRKTFYKGRIKIIPDNIYDLIDYSTLAYIIMCNGLYQSNGITLNLQSFSVIELVKLINVFYLKFDLNCVLHKSRNLYVIYINTKSVKKLYPNIEKYIIPEMKYKIIKKYKL